jgi:thiamine-monophosphate kinase
LATPPERGAIKRTGAQVGDFLCVTGELGNSIAGHHLSFTPRIQEAKELLQTLGDDLHAMIDISDGLGQDAAHLLTNGLQIVIDTTALPLRQGATINGAISDGEEYELLFASASYPPSHLATIIGRVEKGNATVITTEGKDISKCGWNHG